MKSTKKNTGLLIVAEGVDGTGKTTIFKILQEILKNSRKPAIYNKGPGGENWIGKLAKRYLSTSLFFLAIIYNTVFCIIPALIKNKTVLQDRYALSFIMNVAPGWLSQILIKLANQVLLKPDILIYFTAEPNIRLKRIAQVQNRWHQKLLDQPNFLAETEKIGLDLYKSFGGKKILVDTTNSDPVEIAQKIARLVLY